MPTKVDYTRELQELYSARTEPAMVQVPELAFLMIDGHGDPDTTAAFGESVEALYAIAYTAKFAIKHGGGEDYGVMPLEGLWWTRGPGVGFAVDDRSAWQWTLMVMQPECVTPEVLEDARARAAAKKHLDAIAGVRLERFAEGSAAQVLHVGPFAAEGPTIQRLHAFIAQQGYALSGRHHEIYLGDPRRAAPDKLKTILRQPASAGRSTDAATP